MRSRAHEVRNYGHFINGERMYAKLPFGTLFVLLGVAALPGASPPVQVARILMALAGAGFGLYLIFFMGVLVARFRLRGLESGERRTL